MKWIVQKYTNDLALVLFAVLAMAYAGTKQRPRGAPRGEGGEEDESLAEETSLMTNDFYVSSLSRGTNSLTVTFEIPVVATIDVFGTTNLLAESWDLLQSVRTREARETVTIPHVTNDMYFVKGVLRELDSDGDGMLDEWEEANGLDKFNAADAYEDSDDDGVPNIYEYMNGGHPFHADAERVPRLVAGAPDGTNGVVTLREALARAEPYSIIEVADGVYSGSDWTNLQLPTNQVMITSAQKGRSRGAVIYNENSNATFLLDQSQTRHTIIQGLRLVLGGKTSLQAAFWVGGSHPFVNRAATAVFRNIDITMLGEKQACYGWYFMHYQRDETILSSCRVNALGTKTSYVRGVWILNYAPVTIENCSFVNFPAESVGILCQTSFSAVLPPPNGVPINIRNCHFDSSFTNAYSFARVEERGDYNVSFANCVMPRPFEESFLPNVATNIICATQEVSRAGYLTNMIDAVSREEGPRYSSFDSDGEPWRMMSAMGADEYYAITNLVCDSDGDGLTDYEEKTVYFTDPFLADFDFDGLSDAEEIADGTDPFDPSSYKRTLTIEVSDGFSLSNELTTVSILTNAMNTSHLLADYSLEGGSTNTLHFLNVTNVLYVSLSRGAFTNALSRTIGARENRVTVSFDVSYLDKDRDTVYDPWEVKYGLSPTNKDDALIDSDGDGLLNIHEFWCDANPLVDDATNSALRIMINSIDNRLIANVTSHELACILPKFDPYEENNFVANTNFWLSGVDTSCVSMWTDQLPSDPNQITNTTPSQRSGVAISKRHILQAAHWAVEVNSHLLFYGTDGHVYTNKVIARSATIGNDIRVGLLETPLPDAVSIAQVMPTNFFNYIGSAYRVPMFFLDQDEQARLIEIAELNFNEKRFYYLGTEGRPGMTANQNRVPYCKSPIGGDSGSPFFSLLENHPILCGVAWMTWYTNFIGFYIDQIQAAMDSLLPTEIEDHQLRIFDFSPYSQIYPERVRR